jgi:hypothetical protein
MEGLITSYDYVTFPQQAFSFLRLVDYFTRFNIDHLEMIRAVHWNVMLSVKQEESHI